MRIKSFITTLVLVVFAHILLAQETPKNPPVNVEVLGSNRGLAFQQIINKKMKSVPRLGFFGVTNLVAEWDDRYVEDLMTQGNLTFQIVKGLDLMGGFHLTNANGFCPTLGLIYTFSKPNFTMVLNPRFDVLKNGVFETFGMLEFRPKINEKFKFYGRLQGVYGEYLVSPKTLHARSYFVARAGLTYSEFNFGLGTNLDWYGPAKKNINSFGAFLGVALF